MLNDKCSKFELQLYFDCLSVFIDDLLNERDGQIIGFLGFSSLLIQWEYLLAGNITIYDKSFESLGRQYPAMSFKSPEQCIGEESELFILSRTYFWEIYRGYPQTVQQKIYLPCIRDLEKYLHYEFSSEEKRIVVNLPIKFKSIIKHIDLSSVNNLCLGGGLNVFQDYLTLDIIEGCQYHHDLTKKLPFDNESIENISLSHVLEYFERKLAASIMGDCFRVLKPGGVVRIAVPDFDIFIDAYVKKDRDFLEQKVKVNGRSVDRWPGASLSDRVMHLAYGCNGHKDFYSYESLKSILQDAGFSDIRRCSFREGRLLNTEVIDNRPEHSLYVEACK